MDLADYVNDLPPSSRLGPLREFLSEEKLASPIDMYRKSIRKILDYGTEDLLRNSDFIGRLLVIGVVSAAEAYFRAVLSACIELCPLARTLASNKTVNLGGLLWHGKSGFSRSALEHLSFASKDELVKSFKQYLGIPLGDNLFKDPLDQFETVCQLRHGIVHVDGLLPGTNAVQLDIERYKRPVRIIVRYEQVQDVAAIVNTLVMTVNRHVFERMCQRWAVEWRRRADWDPEAEQKSFNAIWNIFYCTEEARSRVPRSQATRGNCLIAVKAQYGI